jgi:transcriptional regulator with XRE-family HTH domain
MKIEEKIKQLREEKGYSQEYMATQLDLTPSAYGKIERGITELSVSKATKIAKVFSTSLSKLFDIDDSTSLSITTNNGHQSLYTNSEVYHYQKEFIDTLLKNHLNEIGRIESQLKLKDDLITTLMKKIK